MYKLSLGLLYFISSLAIAETSFRFDIYGSAVNQTWNESSPFNENNDVLQVPTWTYTLELRPDIQYNFTDNHSVVLRSRHFSQYFETNYLQPDETKTRSEGDSDLNDLFFSSNWTDGISTTIGLQNYQWGPAEIFSPSNPFFHFNNNQKGFFYKEKGRVLTRLNWNPDPETAKWSVIGLIEPVDNNTTFWTADREFKPKAAIKVEYQFANPANSIAVIAGQGDAEKAFFGEYFNWSPEEGFSLYADIQHKAGRTNYIPQINALQLYDMVAAHDTKIYTFAVAGFRWEGRVDFRQEFIFNEAGFSEEEWNLARTSATTLSPNILTNSKRFAAPGLEFRTQSYSYTSIRIPDLGLSHMASVSARWLSSMIHDSSALQLNLEYNWSDNLVLSAEAIQYLGSSDGEFRIIDDKQASLGFRWSY